MKYVNYIFYGFLAIAFINICGWVFSHISPWIAFLLIAIAVYLILKRVGLYLDRKKKNNDA